MQALAMIVMWSEAPRWSLKLLELLESVAIRKSIEIG